MINSPYRYLLSYWKSINNNEKLDLEFVYPIIRKKSNVYEEEALEKVKPILEEQGYKYCAKHKCFIVPSQVYGYKNYPYALEKDSNYVIYLYELYKGIDGKYYHKHSLPIENINSCMGKAHVFLDRMGLFGKGISEIRLSFPYSVVYYSDTNSWLWEVSVVKDLDVLNYKVTEKIKSDTFTYFNIMPARSNSWNLLSESDKNINDIRNRISLSTSKIETRDLYHELYEAICGRVYGLVKELVGSEECVVSLIEGKCIIDYRAIKVTKNISFNKELCDLLRVLKEYKRSLKSVRLIIPEGKSRIYKYSFIYPSKHCKAFDMVLQGVNV